MVSVSENGSPVEALEKAIAGSRRITPTLRQTIPILTPTLGMVSMWWHAQTIDLLWPLNMGKAVIPKIDFHGNEIAEMRNWLVTAALASEKHHNTDIPWLFWLDDDVIIHRCALLALVRHNADIAAGVYFCKGEYGQPLIFDGPSAGTAEWHPAQDTDAPDATCEKWGWAQGLCLIKSEVYKRMRDELDLGVDKYGQTNWYKCPEFGMDANGGLTLGGTEDFHFFTNANRLGYRCVVDQSAHAFGFHYDAGEKVGYPKKQWQQWLRREPIVWPTKEGEVVWA